MAQAASHPASELVVHYSVPRWCPAWAVPEDVPVPETDTHDAAIDYLKALLSAWVARSGRDVKVARNLGIRWVPEEPRFGFDPDLCLIEPSPPRDEPLSSLRTWVNGHTPPRLAIEVVSPGHPYKDYVDTPERCAACGIFELWIYDPMLVGPSSRGGPHLLQLWRSNAEGGFERVHAGAGPVRSTVLAAWLHPRASRLPSSAHLVLCEDEAGTQPWLTSEEQARLEEQRARAAEQRARAAEQRARAAEQQARTSEREAHATERRARELLESERNERAALERRVRELEDARRRK